MQLQLQQLQQRLLLQLLLRAASSSGYGHQHHVVTHKSYKCCNFTNASSSMRSTCAAIGLPALLPLPRGALLAPLPTPLRMHRLLLPCLSSLSCGRALSGSPQHAIPPVRRANSTRPTVTATHTCPSFKLRHSFRSCIHVLGKS